MLGVCVIVGFATALDPQVCLEVVFTADDAPPLMCFLSLDSNRKASSCRHGNAVCRVLMFHWKANTKAFTFMCRST